MSPLALLVLEDGRAFSGHRFGSLTDAGGEVVFNTAMSGYQEILGDPSYAGQVVTMTYPMMGNYGIAPEDFESRRVFLSALVVKEASGIASNWRHTRTLDSFLEAEGVPGIAGIDTRALVRHLRSRGTMRGVIGDAAQGVEALVLRARGLPDMTGSDLARTVTAREPYGWDEASPALGRVAHPAPNGRQHHVVVYDFGVKRNILRRLVDVGCRVTVVPADHPAADVLALEPDGVMLSNGPGDPEPVRYGIDNVRALLGRVPIFGICLGHQLLCLAAGARSYKLKFGHRGANHPVKDLTTGRVEITSQNHGFAIDPESFPAEAGVQVTHVNLNDHTLAGIQLEGASAFSVQYHPEAAPGPRDASHLFERFVRAMDAWRSQHA
ncbi:MAG: glutamine-hydrolyzing carbamoyl-phosphate synthase small subunit [Sandaracinaceae bacterium]|nr:glutamine-hydrolyzing carbamoyl-phosphate synthase small subunit [Sandaracinaceae bacterium]